MTTDRVAAPVGGTSRPARPEDGPALLTATDDVLVPTPADGLIGELAEGAPLVAPSTPSVTVQDMFRLDPTLRWVVMADPAGPVLVERAWFEAQMTGPLGYGRLIHSRSRLSALRHQPSVVLPDRTPVAQAAATALARQDPGRSFDGIVVVAPDGAATVASVTSVFERLARHYAYQSLHDPLTGLPNRLFVMHQLSRRPDSGSVLLYVDLDRFKDVNDQLGHGAGDQVLAQFADRLRSVSREGDVVARLGGDEFVVLTGSDLSELQSSALAERLVLAAAAPYVVTTTDPDDRAQEHLVTIGASVGIARAGVRPVHLSSLEVLLKQADLAMYRAKSRGRGRVEHYRPELAESSAGGAGTPARRSMERRLRTAIAGHALHLQYQPIVDLPHGRLRAVEALARWDDDELGSVAPDVFIGLAEETGLILDLGRWVLTEACRQAARWTTDGAPAPTVSVNVSPVQLAEQGFLTDVRAALAQSGLVPTRLCLEITETAAVGDLAVTADLLGQLRGLGVQVALDDFGTGHSSLTLLRRLPVDLVKVDRSFVERVASDAGDAVLVRLVVDAAHSLGMRVCAEGVEREDQARQLHALGCDVAQGWLFGRPAAPEVLASTWLGGGHSVTRIDVDQPPALALTGRDELVLVMTPDHVVTYASSSCQQLLGRSPADVVGTVLPELVELGPETGTVHLTHADGTPLWLRGRLQSLHDGPDRRGELLGVFSDVTDVVERERELAAHEELFKHAFDDAPIGIALSDLSGRILRVNRSFTELVGRTPEELMALSVADITHPDDRAVDAQNLAATEPGRHRTLRVLKRYLHADGEPVDVEVHAATVPAVAGRPACIVAHVLPSLAPGTSD